MNGQTAKIIRRVAKKRGNTKPTYIRHLKREYYALCEEEKELKRIAWLTELDEYETEIREDLQQKIDSKDLRVSDCLSQISSLRGQVDSLKEKYDATKSSVRQAKFWKRLLYLFTGNLELRGAD